MYQNKLEDLRKNLHTMLLLVVAMCWSIARFVIIGFFLLLLLLLVFKQ
jgi:hypothetical protein